MTASRSCSEQENVAERERDLDGAAPSLAGVPGAFRHRHRQQLPGFPAAATVAAVLVGGTVALTEQPRQRQRRTVRLKGGLAAPDQRRPTSPPHAALVPGQDRDHQRRGPDQRTVIAVGADLATGRGVGGPAGSSPPASRSRRTVETVHDRVLITSLVEGCGPDSTSTVAAPSASQQSSPRRPAWLSSFQRAPKQARSISSCPRPPPGPSTLCVRFPTAFLGLRHRLRRHRG